MKVWGPTTRETQNPLGRIVNGRLLCIHLQSNNKNVASRNGVEGGNGSYLEILGPEDWESSIPR